MRKVIGFLVALLFCSVALNIVLFGRTRALDRERKISQHWLAAKGSDQGAMDAERDFAAGTPKWYCVGGFGGVVPPDKPGRTLATVGCLVTDFELAYVESYNRTMDGLFMKKGNGLESNPSP